MPIEIPDTAIWAPEDKLPALMLAVRINEFTKLGDGREWVRWMHQTAGIGCHQHDLIGTLLTPRPAVRALMDHLAEEWFGSEVAFLGHASLDEVLRYRDLLTSLGLSCNVSYRDLEEGIYPLDCIGTAEYVRRACLDDLPDELDDLLVLNHKWACMGSIYRWRLLILTENSD